MDMKVSGMYIARQLSFAGVSFRIEEIALDNEFKQMYNKAARLVRPFPFGASAPAPNTAVGGWVVLLASGGCGVGGIPHMSL